MLEFTKYKHGCTGCTACMSACPVKCITMETDAEGFEYPVASDACIHCGLCERICPIENEVEQPVYADIKAYALLTRDKNIWRRSASGGAFSEICRAWGNDQAVVVGAAWDGLKVHHKCVIGVDNIAELCKSKYVASLPKNTFSEIKNFLKEGRTVIFCGTPCQVAGLKSFLREKNDNLLTIDFICHGVGSPAVFRDTVKVIGNQFGEEINSYEFRAKRKVHETDHLQKIASSTSETYLLKDQYIQLFLSQLCLRPSCGEHCRFRKFPRQGDLTIADFKGLSEIFPDLVGTKRNYSTVVTNSIKGEEVISRMKNDVVLRSTSIDSILQYNPLLGRQTWFATGREAFFKDYEENPLKAIVKWTEPATVYKPSFKQRIRNMLPTFLIKALYKIVRR